MAPFFWLIIMNIQGEKKRTKKLQQKSICYGQHLSGKSNPNSNYIKVLGNHDQKELQGNQQKKNGCESTMNLAFHKILCQSNQSLRNG